MTFRSIDAPAVLAQPIVYADGSTILSGGEGFRHTGPGGKGPSARSYRRALRRVWSVNGGDAGGTTDVSAYRVAPDLS